MERNKKDIIQELNLYSDPLSILVNKFEKVNICIGTLVIVLLLNIPIIITASVNDLLHSIPGRIGLLQDYNWWFLNLTSIPATILFLLWMPQGIKKIIKDLIDNNVIVIQEGNSNDVRWNSFITESAKVYTHWIWPMVSLIATASFMKWFAVPQQRLFLTWQTTGEFIFWCTIFYWTFIFYHGSLVVIRGILVFIFLNRLFRNFNIDVKVLHPDGAGGLSPLSSFSVKIGYLLGVYGLASVTSAFSMSYITTTKLSGVALTPDLLLLYGIFIVIAPIAFFAPIGAARSAMKKAKEEFLLRISDQYEVDSDKVNNLIGSESEELNKGLTKLDLLQKMHKTASNFPVWPFNTKNIVRFASSVSVPLSLPGLVDLISKINDLIKK